MSMTRDQNVGLDGNTERDNKFFLTVEQLKYLETILTIRSSIHEEIKSKFKSGMLAIIRHRTFCLHGCYPEV